MSDRTPRGGVESTAEGAVLLDGRALRDEILADLRGTVERAGRPPVTMGTILVGDDRASRTYVGYKHKAAAQAGLRTVGVTLTATASQAELEEAVAGLSADRSVHGVFLQLPLPDHLDDIAALAHLDPAKDIDGMTTASLARLVLGEPGYVPCTALGVARLLERYHVTTAGRHIVMLGRSTLVGVPLTLLLSSATYDAVVTLADPDQADPRELCRLADIVVSDVSRPRMVTADWIRPGATVVDVGVSRVDGHLVGDVDFAAVRAVAGAIAPNPGGAGPMTVACLLENTVAAARAAGLFETDGTPA